VGRIQEAIEAYGKALEIHRGLEDWYRASQTLENLGCAHEDYRHFAEARAHYLQAADAFDRANAPERAAAARTAAATLPLTP
jgi:tetratricopeptide (TPR) repeat protein